MPRHVEAWLDGIALSNVGPILIQQVHEDAPKQAIITGERPGRYGQMLLSSKRQSLSVTIEAAIRELHSLHTRAEIVERMGAWAQGHSLELSNHPGRCLEVVCTGVPALGDVRDYTENIRLAFEAYEVPYWQDKTPARLTMAGGSGEGLLPVPGTVEAPVSLTVTPTGGKLTNLTVRVGAREIVLSGLSVDKDVPLIMERDRRDTLAIRCGGASQLSHRTAESDDDLMAMPGKTTVSFSASTACKAIFSVRGRWA